MKIISQQECQEWFKTKLAKDFSREAVEANYPDYVTYRLPIDTGKKTALARALTRSIDMSRAGLFWITSWGIYPSSENMGLFDGYRRFLGESRTINAAPGHIFDESEAEKLECLLDLAFYFYWDASLLDGAGTIAVRTSHDECFSVLGKNIAYLQDFESKLGRLELKLLGRSK
jgi:hypothetical protein